MRKSFFTVLAVTLLLGFGSYVYSEEVNTDVNGDGEVNILDLVRVASFFGESVSAENAVADVNGDGEINILDLVAVANDFGKSNVPTEPSDEPGSITNEDVVSEPVAPAENTQDTFVVGITLPRTGHLAATGAMMKSGFELALSEINEMSGVSMKYILVDDKGTAEGAVAAFEALIHEELEVL